MSIEELSVNLGFESGLERRTVRTDRLGLRRPRFAQTDRSYTFQETLGLESRGNLIDERTILYDVAATWGLSQERFKESKPGLNLTSEPDGTILEYDVALQAFPAGKVSANAFASQLDDRLPRPFLPSLDRRRERYGAGLTYNDPVLPMELAFEHVFDEFSSGRRDLVDEEELGEDSLRYEATWQPDEHHSLNLQYEYERRSEQYSGTPARFDTTRNYLALDHALDFGDRRQHRLDTYIRLEDEDGDLARDAFEFSPQVRLRHTDKLSSTHRAQFLRESFFEIDASTVRGDLSLDYQPLDNLTATAGFYGQRQNVSDNPDIGEWGGLIDLSYHQPNRLGRFSADLSYLHSETDTDGGDHDGVVVNESVTFRDPLPAQLAHPYVNLTSILVSDERRAIVYLPGIDYVVLQIKDVTVLQRIPTGRILDRQTVFVSYTYRVLENFFVRRDRIDLRLRQELGKGWEVYHAFSFQDEAIDRQASYVYRDRDIHRHRIGLECRRDRWSTGAEYEINDDSIDPYQAMHLSGDVVFWQEAPHELDGRTTFSFFRFDGEDFLPPRDTSLLDLGLSYRYLLANNLEAAATGAYRFQSDSIYGETNGFDLRGTLSYRIGLFTLLVETEYDVLDLPYSTDDSFGVWVKLRRDIPVIGSKVN